MASGFPSFAKLIGDFRDTWRVPTTIGFQLTQSFPVAIPGHFRWRLLFPPCELVEVGPDSFDPSPNFQRIAEGILTIPFPIGTLRFIAGTNFLASVQATPSSFCSISGQLSKLAAKPFDCCVALTAATSIANFHSELSLHRLRLSATFGIENLAVGLSANLPRAAPSLLVQFPIGRFRGQAVARLDKQTIRIQIADDRCGIYAALGPTAPPYVEVAWRLRINRFNIHSSVDTRGFVRSFLGTRVNSGCTIAFHAELSHGEERYRSGLALNFEKAGSDSEKASKIE
jgi:hypothetical protein